MNKYEIYISENKCIKISADEWETRSDHKLLIFMNEKTKENVAVFNVNNILGWAKV